MSLLLKNTTGNPTPDQFPSLKDDSREKYVTERINLTGQIAQLILGELSRLHNDHSREVAAWFTLWKEHCDRYFDLHAAETILADDVRGVAAGTRLFLAHSYGKIVLDEIVRIALGPTGNDALSGGLYDWIGCFSNADLNSLRSELRNTISINAAELGPIECSDLIATVYQEIFPPALRHLLGEYYTPSWLVEYCLKKVEQRLRKSGAQVTVFDPAAGSGSFLAHYIARIGNGTHSTRHNIVGFDINPLAVDFCRANALLSVSKVSDWPQFSIRVHLTDAVVDPIPDSGGPLFRTKDEYQRTILGVTFNNGEVQESDLETALKPFCLSTHSRNAFFRTLKRYISDAFAGTIKVGADVIVGNPPWISWDGLTRKYRDALAPQWSASTLVVNSGWRAKVSAGKTDFSSLFVYRAAQRHAAPGATMVFVLPLSLFQSHLAGAGFRTFSTTENRKFGLVELNDFSQIKVFPDAVNRTSVGTFLVDTKPEYPIQYLNWSIRNDRSDDQLTCVSSLGGPLIPSELSSPIVAFRPGQTELETVAGKSDYRARGGVNTGGANTILWLEVLSETDAFCQVRNVGRSRRGSSPVVTAEVEKAAVYPLLCGADLHRWRAIPSRSILLLYEPDCPKKALPLSYVQTNLPKAYEFVSRFRSELEGRKEYFRWGCSGPFYEVYRIGPYTFCPIKVLWQHTGYRKSLRVSVVDDRGRRPAIPDQKAILIPFADLEEAHYVCAFLSSSPTATLLDRYLGTDASTHILDYMALRQFRPDNLDHQRLAKLSISAHKAATQQSPVKDFEEEIDGIVKHLMRK